MGERAYDRITYKDQLHVGIKRARTMLVGCSRKATLVVDSRSNLREGELVDTRHRSPSTFSAVPRRSHDPLGID